MQHDMTLRQFMRDFSQKQKYTKDLIQYLFIKEK